ncbi:MAG: PP2C family protein-serine/threonine phosphatase [Candidatus Eisenbacteria bacterium]|nr:PP2C family protein-serine/threonine phosphatase [Candidatus Eisenbacteria bacterium]
MDYASLLATAYLLVGVLTTLLGLVIFREDTSARINRVTALMLFFAGVGSLLGAGSLFVPASSRAGFPASLVTQYAWLWEFFFPALLLFAASFPHEAGWLHKGGSGELAIFVPHLIHFFLMFFAMVWGPSFGLDRLSARLPLLAAVLDPVRVLLSLFFRWHRYLFSLVNLTYIGISIFLIFRNHARVRVSSLRNQMRTILVGMGIGLVLYSLGGPLNVLLGLRLGGAAASTLLVGSLAACAGTIAYAIVRHRFLDVRWIVRRTILYATAGALLIAIYLQIARRVARVLTGALPIDPGVIDWAVLLVPVFLFQPLMSRIEESLEGWILKSGSELRALSLRVGDRISQSLEFEPLAEDLVRQLPETLGASGAAILLLPGERHGPPPGGRYRPLRATGFDGEMVERLASLAPYLPEPLGAGRPFTAREWREAMRAAQDPHSGVLAAAGLRAAAEADAPVAARPVLSPLPPLSYELRHGGERLGLLVLGTKLSGMRYRGEEIQVLASLAGQAGIALRNSLLHRDNLEKAVLEEELAVARKIQQTFLPSRFPEGLPFEVHGLSLPSKQVGGDSFDFFPVKGGGYGIAIADVAGKGVGAALLASMLQASLRTLLREDPDTARACARVNQLLYESTGPEQFVTLFLAHIDPREMVLTFCNAGHNYPVRFDHATCALLEPSDLLLGVMEEAVYSEQRLRLHPGDCLLLYTDGATEARSRAGEEFGEERLISLLEGRGRICTSAREVVESVRDEVIRFTGSQEMQDDMTLLCVRVPSPRGARDQEAATVTAAYPTT